MFIILIWIVTLQQNLGHHRVAGLLAPELVGCDVDCVGTVCCRPVPCSFLELSA